MSGYSKIIQDFKIIIDKIDAQKYMEVPDQRGLCGSLTPKKNVTPESRRTSSRTKKPKKLFDPGSLSCDGQRYLETNYTPEQVNYDGFTSHSSYRMSKRKCLFGKLSESRDSSPEIGPSTAKRFKISRKNESNTPKHVKKEDIKNTSELNTPTHLKPDVLNTPTHLKPDVLNTPRHRLKSLTPGLSARRNILRTPTTPMDHARQLLHVSTIPDSLPCRQSEFDTIYNYLFKKIRTKTGGSMYISGVPGTGKTATVLRVVKKLEEDYENNKISHFQFVEINSLQLTEPHQAYCKFWKKLSGCTVTAEQAQKALEKKFSSKRSKKEIVVLLIDELDFLCNKRQDVIYNILDWPSRDGSRLVVLTIANTMDLPERTLKGRVTSRMGLTRLVFQPYTYQQLQTIVLNRLSTNESFHPDAVQLAARKVASISGDARRALDICRRAVDICCAEGSSNTVTIAHVEEAVASIMSNPVVLAIKCCSIVEQLILRSIRDECMSNGLDTCTLDKMYNQFHALCTLEGVTAIPTTMDTFSICASLNDRGLLLTEKRKNVIVRQKLSLNVSSDDIHYALNL